MAIPMPIFISPDGAVVNSEVGGPKPCSSPYQCRCKSYRPTTTTTLVLTQACPNTVPPRFHAFGLFLEPSLLRFQPNGEGDLWLWARCRKGQYGWQSVGVAVIPCALVFWGVC